MKKIAIVLLAAMMLLAISCDEQPQHEHKFSEEWKSNETQHWHECECQEKSGVADHDYETITVESTCSKKGSETVKCKVCGYVKSTKELELKAHTPAEEHIITDSTCSKEGSDVVKCTVCGEVVSSKVIEKKEHTPAEEHVIVAPSCSEFGSDSVVCSVCKEVIATYSAKTEHTSGASQVVKTATCSEEGLSEVKCTVCNEVISSTPIACIPHTWGEWVTDEESVLKTRTCTVCKATETSGSVVLPPEVMNVAMAYDMLIGSVSYNDVSGVAFIEKENRILSTDKLLYDFKNFEAHMDGNYSCEIKLSNEEAYHHYSFIMDNYEETISDVSIDGVKQGEEYVANNDPYIIAFSNYLELGLEMVMHFNVKNVEVKNAEKVTYYISFESDYDPSRSYETRYMKIVDVEGNIKLEYTMKVIGLNSYPVPIASAIEKGSLKMGETVGLFTVDGVSYDIDSVNAVITEMFKSTV
ncbi:MAG: hypothetical protein ACI4NI_01190 [Candidatus Ornithospirochaeta sp.]